MEESTERILLILEFRFFVASSRLRAKKRNVGERRMFTPAISMFSFG